MTVSYSYDIRVIGNGSLVQNCTINLFSDKVAHKVYFENINFIGGSVVITNVTTTFTNCSLRDTLVRDSSDVAQKKHVKIKMNNSIYTCSNQTKGIRFFGTPIGKILIQDTTFELCTIELHVQEVALSMFNSLLYDVSFNVTVTSFFKIPSIIHLEYSTFQNHVATNRSLVMLSLNNPHVTIKDCTFHKAPVNILPEHPEATQSVFHVSIVNATFTHATKQSSGGALLIASHIEFSKVLITNSTFAHNNVINKGSTLSGNGGAVAVTGDKLQLVIENSTFENNSAPDLGTALFASEGVALLVQNCTFHYDITKLTRHFGSLLVSHGPSRFLNIAIIVNNFIPEIYMDSLHIFKAHSVLQMNVSIICPEWSKYNTEYEKSIQTFPVVSQVLANFIYECNPCFEMFYTASSGHDRITYLPENNLNLSAVDSNLLLGGSVPLFGGLSQTNISVSQYFIEGTTEVIHSSKPRGCVKCSYGAYCSGNKIYPRPNYWGYWYKDVVDFQQCPSGYCCSGTSDAPCYSYNYCAGNRTGDLCGACREGFSVSILTGNCVRDENCRGMWWFWVLVGLAALAYAMWYTLKDDILAIPLLIALKILAPIQERFYRTKNQPTTSSEFNDIGQSEKKAGGEAGTYMSTKWSDNLPAAPSQDTNVDKGYFGIIAYFVQMAQVIYVKIEFSDIDKSDSVLDKITSYIGYALNIELSSISVDVCPIAGLTTFGKNAYKLVFLVTVYVSWLLVYAMTFLIEQCFAKHRPIFWNFRLKLIRGLVEIIKYTYAGFCAVIFMCVVCVKLRDSLVWFHDGTVECYTYWQWLMVAFSVIYAIPFPLVLLVGMKLLRHNRISSTAFLLSCLCPLVALGVIGLKEVIHKCKGKGKQSELSTKPIPTVSKEVLSVLQGPFRTSAESKPLYWEAVISFRRLLLSAMIFIPFISIRMVITVMLCVLFQIHHAHVMPFQNRNSNHIETLSLNLLVLAAVFNLLKSTLTDTGAIPTGPTVPFFKTLEFAEKAMVILLIAAVILVEVKSRLQQKVIRKRR